MNKPHKHAAAIKAWADGKKIQVASPPEPTYTDPLAQREPDWFDLPAGTDSSWHPSWHPALVYRVKSEPLEWQAEREAHARGEAIEFRNLNGGHWTETNGPSWSSGYEYRVKPKPHKWQAEMDAYARGEAVEFSDDGGKTWQGDRGHGWHWFSEPSRFMYRIKPKTKTTRLRVAAMGLKSGEGEVWTVRADDDAQAKKYETDEHFLCWLGDWKEIERPVSPNIGAARISGATIDERTRRDLERAASQVEQQEILMRRTTVPGSINIGWGLGFGPAEQARHDRLNKTMRQALDDMTKACGVPSAEAGSWWGIDLANQRGDKTVIAGISVGLDGTFELHNITGIDGT